MQFVCHNPQKYPCSPQSLQHLKWLEHLTRLRRVMGWHPTWNSGFLNNYNNLLFIRCKIAFKYDLMLTSTSTYLHIYIFSSTWCSNKPFYRYGGHIEFIRFKGYYGMPRGEWARSDVLASVLTRAFSGPFFFNFFLKKDFNGKKDRCAVFGRNNDRLFPEKYTLKFSFCPKSARKYWASAPWASHNTP